jgi:hypothetical protein
MCKTVEDVWKLDMESVVYEELLTPVPHACDAADIKEREAALGAIGLYYPMLYTTLFMWPVEVLGWELFILAATYEPQKFHSHFLQPCVRKSREIITRIAEVTTSPFVFVHDDLAYVNGPIFRPDWYDEWIFPHYPKIWEPAKRCGKKVIFVADGNMSVFLPRLLECGVDGLMFEVPATPIEQVIEHFNLPEKFLIGGVSTSVLRFGSPAEVRSMVYDLNRLTRDCPGFALASGGGLHGDIPLENLIAYFDARVEIHATPRNWKCLSEW